MFPLGSGAIKDTKAIGVLSGAIQAPSASTQCAACLALVAIGTGTAIEAVARVLLHGEEEVRQYAAEAMANDPVEGQAMLKEGLSMDDILLRRAVVFGLKRVKENWAVQMLENKGVEILTCGTCLQHFGLENELKAGKVTNMFEVIETLNQAGKVISPD